MGALDALTEGLSREVAGRLDDSGRNRLAALHAARSVMPDADVYDRIRLARYILTGSEEEPAPPDYEDVTNMAGEVVVRRERPTQTEDYPFTSGDVLVLGPEIFAGSEDKINVTQPDSPGVVINWRGVNFVPQQQPQALIGVVGPDPEFEAALKDEPAPSAGLNWRGRRGREG